MRIALIGTAGTGKGLLSINLAKELSIPNINVKNKIYEILKMDGFDYMRGVQVEKFLAENNRQDKIVEYLIQQEDLNNSFVTDKSIFEIAAYALAERAEHDTESVQRIIELCKERAKKYTHIFVCPFRMVKLEPNGVRTMNEPYQYKISLLELGILKDMGINYIELKTDNGKRVSEIMEVLNVERN